jgi:hypothetical protein
MKIIQEKFIPDKMPMKSSRAEAAARRFHRIDDDRGNVWLVADQVSAAEHIYFDNPRDTSSDGFGGSVLTFKLVDGREYKAKGPWHSNADSLFAATGHDVRDTHYTYVVIGLDRAKGTTNGIEDVIYMDNEATLGSFKRGDEIAQQIANEIGTAVQVYSQSNGGSSCGPMYPSDWDEDRIQEYWQEKHLTNTRTSV